MTFLDEIRSAEKEAKAVCQRAQQDAEDKIEQAEKRKNVALKQQKEALQEEERTARQDGEQEADALGKDMTEKGKAQIIALKEAANKQQDAVIEQVLRSI